MVGPVEMTPELRAHNRLQSNFRSQRESRQGENEIVRQARAEGVSWRRMALAVGMTERGFRLRHPDIK